MIKRKVRAFSIFYFILGLTLFVPSTSHAQCTSPAGNAGNIDYFSSGSDWVHKYCDGTNWVPWAGAIHTGIPAPQYSSSGGVALDDLTDVDTTGVADGEVLMYSAGGSLWISGAGGGGTPGGVDTQIQFNSSGAFGADADLTWNVATNTMTTINIDYTGYITDVSDKRLKENIVPLSNSLEGLMALQGYSFTMKGDESAAVEYGLMAQDVQAVFPELVKTKDDGSLALNYIGLIAPLVEANKEQQAEIESLKARLEALEARYGTGSNEQQKQTGEQ